MTKINRREYLAASASVCLLAGCQPMQANGGGNQAKTKVAAIQFSPVLADVDRNLEQCRELALKAIEQGARWIVLPEFFSSGLAMDPKLWDAFRPVDGEPARLLVALAKEHGVNIGGSFLAQSGTDVFNTFVLATADGRIHSHDKDFPSTIFESSFYAGGEDDKYVEKINVDGFDTAEEEILTRRDNNVDGVFEVGELNVGAALCWELVRFRTAQRLRERIDLLLGASGWWWGSPEFGWREMDNADLKESRERQLQLINTAPKRLARMIGTPVVHTNFVGINHSYADHDFANPANKAKAAKVTGRYLGQSQLVNADGSTVAHGGEERGVVIGEVQIGRRDPLEAIPEKEFWMPELDEGNRLSWSESGAKGRDFYLTRTRAEIEKRFGSEP